MQKDIILASDSNMYQAFEQATNKRIVFFTGLSGVGKSLYIQQFSKMAERAGRVVHLLQWDVTREAFQTPAVMQKYPEIAGVTHPMIRKAVGLWTRCGIADWHARYSDDKHILIGELPLIGNRLMEVVQALDDQVESLLAGKNVQFFLPVPSREVRAHILSCRTSSIDDPNHEREAADAPPSVVNLHWQQIRQLAIDLGLADGDCSADYQPQIYSAAYQHLLQHRNALTLPVTEVLDTRGSVYELGAVASEISASAEQVTSIFNQVERQYSLRQVEQMVDNWHQI
ncbi:MAG: hypothetical protein OFPI_19600 [Osedax symbiont Rs2]|nr:MAG: hypothetical protein OFPI_19600 [Osedax symbiont Rs2]